MREEGKDDFDTEAFGEKTDQFSRHRSGRQPTSGTDDQMRCLATTDFPGVLGVYLKSVLDQGA